MGFLSGLFAKKDCDLCGGDIGFLGNRKLKDGDMCKECAKKLSPWFDERRQSTVAQIEEQLKYREENRKKVAVFRTTRTLGENTKVLLDEDAGRFMVTSERNLAEANPDVLDFSDITGCTLDIDENRTEIKREDADGNEISYQPPRYTYDYDFYIIINVRNPYFDEMRFKLNSRSVEIDNISSRGMGLGGMRPVGGGFFGNTQQMMGPENDPEYLNYKEMGEEIKAALLQVRQQVRSHAEAGTAPKRVVTCPFCGGSVTPNAAGCCDFCGGILNV